MNLTFVRRPGRRSLLLLTVAVLGATVAGIAYMTSPALSDPSTAGARPTAAPPPEPSPGAKIRVPMFVDPALVKPMPRFRFSFDPPEVLAPLRHGERLDEVVAGAQDDLDRAVRLMRWTRAQWEPGIPSPYPPIDAHVILRDIRRGFTGGFCAQYNYVLAQALQSFGVRARYVSLIEHEVIEAEIPSHGGWICLDPLYATWYMDDDGNPLSVLAIHEHLRSGRTVRLADPRLVQDVPAHLAAFEAFAVWLKNDHITAPVNFTDLERYKVHFVPEGSRLTVPEEALRTSEPADLYPEDASRPGTR